MYLLDVNFNLYLKNYILAVEKTSVFKWAPRQCFPPRQSIERKSCDHMGCDTPIDRHWNFGIQK